MRLGFAADPRPRSRGGADDAATVVVVARRSDEIDVEAGVRAGVTDWLLWPFKESYARTRHAALGAAPGVLLAAGGGAGARRSTSLRAVRLCVCSTRRPRSASTATRDSPLGCSTCRSRSSAWSTRPAVVQVALRHRSARDAARAWRSAPTRSSARPCCRFPMPCRTSASPTTRSSPDSRACVSTRGAPLAAADGSLVGTLCLIDRRARHLDAQQLGLLRDLADLVEGELVSARLPDRSDAGAAMPDRDAAKRPSSGVA